MELDMEPGKYVVAVSGGVDSVSLLHMLQEQPEVYLVVAHFDHGIRTDSVKDTLHVKYLAEAYGLPFVTEEGRLGPGAGEAAARAARYAFLREARRRHGARAIITAHHQDDVLETAIINLLRGTGRKGLSSLGSHGDLARPLLGVQKPAIIAYALEHGLEWREDNTNADENYLRNYVRSQLLPRIGPEAREKLLDIVASSGASNREIDTLLVKYIPASSGESLDRLDFSLLPHAVAREVMAAWLRSHGLRDFNTPALERLVVAAKVGQPGNRFDVRRSYEMLVGADSLALTRAER